MQTKSNVNLHDISLLLSSKLNLSERDSVNFLNELFDILLSQALTEEGIVVDSIGSFSVHRISIESDLVQSAYKLIFTPDNSIQSLVNKPFENFEPTELSQDVMLDGVSVVDKTIEKEIDLEDESILFIERKIVEEVEEETDVDIVQHIEEKSDVEEPFEFDLSVPEDPPVVELSEQVTMDVAVHQQNVEDRKFRSRSIRKNRSVFALGVAVGVVVIITASAFFFQRSLFD